MRVKNVFKKAAVVGLALVMTVGGSTLAFAAEKQTRGGTAFLCDSYSNETYAGNTHVWYTVGVEYETGYVEVSTDEDSDFSIEATAYDIWALAYNINTGASQTRACSGSVRNYSEDQMTRVDYTIRVDGPESGTTISGDEVFWA